MFFSTKLESTGTSSFSISVFWTAHCTQAGFHACAAVRLAGRSGFRGGTTADKISGNTLPQQGGEGGRKELFHTADQTLSADGSCLLGTVWPFLPPLMGNTEHERETPMGLTGALESLYLCLCNIPSHAHRMTSR